MLSLLRFINIFVICLIFLLTLKSPALWASSTPQNISLKEGEVKVVPESPIEKAFVEDTTIATVEVT